MAIKFEDSVKMRFDYLRLKKSANSYRCSLSFLILNSLLVVAALAPHALAQQDRLDSLDSIERREVAPPPAAPEPPAGGQVAEPEPVPPTDSGSGQVFEPEPPVEPAAPVTPVPRVTRPPVVITPPAQPRVTNIRFGGVAPGTLGRTDYLTEDSRRLEFFTFEGRKGQPVVLTLHGSNDRRTVGNQSLTPYMIVYSPDGAVVARNDVAGGERTLADERLRIRLPEEGQYRVAIFAEPNDEGRFSLALQRDTVIYRYEQEGELTESSTRLRLDDSPAEVFRFQGTKGQFVNILALSPDFDPYLFLIGPDGEVITQDDNSGGNLNALIATELEENGTYTVVINSFNREGRGRYRLTIF